MFLTLSSLVPVNSVSPISWHQPSHSLLEFVWFIWNIGNVQLKKFLKIIYKSPQKYFWSFVWKSITAATVGSYLPNVVVLLAGPKMLTSFVCFLHKILCQNHFFKYFLIHLFNIFFKSVQKYVW